MNRRHRPVVAPIMGLALLWAVLPGAVASATAPKPEPLSQIRGSSDQPIDITADRLDVDQNNQVATFTGNVQIVQGEVHLQSASVKVYYDQQKKSGPNSSGQSAIRRLEASGGVVVQAPGETARGDRAVYNVVDRVAEIFGGVVLTRQESVLKGEHLTMNFESGQSRMVGAGSGATGRVRGTFVPQNRQAQGAGRGASH